jgi:hypothetical protein
MAGGRTRRAAAPIWGCLLAAFFAAGCASVRAHFEKPRDPESLLLYLRARAQHDLTRIESDLDGTARMLERTGASGGATRELLEGLTMRHSAIAEAMTAGMDGRIIAFEPVPHRGRRGLLADGVLPGLLAEPGLVRLDQADRYLLWQPIASFRTLPEGVLAATLSLEAIFDDIERFPRIPERVDVWIMTPDGVIAADPDRIEIGRNVFTDGAYAMHGEMLGVMRRIADEPSGRTSYTYFGPDYIVVKLAGWESIELGGTAWRIVVEHVIEGDPQRVARIPTAVRPMTYEHALNAIAADGRLQSAAIEGRVSRVEAVLQDYFERYPGLYNIQWMDANGVTQCGYPPGRSLRGYNHRTLARPGDEWWLEILELRAPHQYTGRLTGGYDGDVFAAPIQNGMVYAVRRN